MVNQVGFFEHLSFSSVLARPLYLASQAHVSYLWSLGVELFRHG